MKKKLLFWPIIFSLLAATILPATVVRAQATEILKPNAYTFIDRSNGNIIWEIIYVY